MTSETSSPKASSLSGLSRLTSETCTEVNRTIACRLTPKLPSAIATIAVRGPDSARIIAQLFVPKTRRTLAVGDVRYGHWNPLHALSTAEQLVVCRVSHSCIEIHAHGGAAVCEAILTDLRNAGCEIVQPAEWPSDTVGKIESQAEHDLQFAATVRVAALLLDQMRGGLSAAVRSAISLLAESQMVCARTAVAELVQWGEIGIRLCGTPCVCLAGPPNVGKSSLLNALLGVNRVIVHPEPGTTRDWVDALAVIAGWPVNLIDTAGIRASDEPVELAGIELAREKLWQSDLSILVVDASVGWTQTHELLLQGFSGSAVIAWNKCDLVAGQPPEMPLPCIRTSAVAAPGVEPLRTAIAAALFSPLPPAGQAVPFRREHIDVLTHALQLITAQKPREAIVKLESLL